MTFPFPVFVPMIAAGSRTLDGEITIGTRVNGFTTFYGYFPDSYGSISGPAAAYLAALNWWFSFGSLAGSSAHAANTTTGTLVFQGKSYPIQESGGVYNWALGNDPEGWPQSGTYPFQIIDP